MTVTYWFSLLCKRNENSSRINRNIIIGIVFRPTQLMRFRNTGKLFLILTTPYHRQSWPTVRPFSASYNVIINSFGNCITSTTASIRTDSVIGTIGVVVITSSNNGGSINNSSNIRRVVVLIVTVMSLAAIFVVMVFAPVIIMTLTTTER